MSEGWDAAVAVAEDGPPADLPAVVAEELIALWSDLSEALRRARQRWSQECDGLVVRIVMLSRLTTATPWQQVPASLLADGIYQGILRSAGVPVRATRRCRDRPCEPGVSRAGPTVASRRQPPLARPEIGSGLSVRELADPDRASIGRSLLDNVQMRPVGNMQNGHLYPGT